MKCRAAAWIRRPWTAAVVLGLCLALGAGEGVAQGDLRPELERAEQVLERTEEVLGRVAESVREADIPKSREFLEDAYVLEKRARRIFEETDAISSRPIALTRLRQAISLSLRARDLGLRAGQHLREQVTLQRRAHRELDQVRTHLQRIHEGVGPDASPQTTDTLRRVRSQLERAEGQLRDGNFEIALRLVQTAAHLLRNFETDGPNDSLPERYSAELQRARDQIQQLRPRLEGQDDDLLRRLGLATELLDQSEERFRDGRAGAAGRLLRQAQGTLADLRADAALDPSEEEIRRAMERVDRALQDLGEVVDASAPANVQRMLERARQAHRRTRDALGAGELAEAVRHHRVSVDLLTRLRSWVDEQSY